MGIRQRFLGAMAVASLLAIVTPFAGGGVGGASAEFVHCCDGASEEAGYQKAGDSPGKDCKQREQDDWAEQECPFQ